MPPFNILFNHTTRYEVEPPINVNGAARVVILDGRGAQLRRMNDDETAYGVGGDYKESWIVCPNWKATGLVDLYGFRVDWVDSGAIIPDVFGGGVAYQLSNDNGITWLYFNGTSWVTAVNQWNTEAEVDYNIPSFPLTSQKQVRVRIKLTPTTGGKKTPLIRRVTIYGDLSYDLHDDLLRSMKHWLEQHVWLSEQYFGELDNSDFLTTVDKKWEEFSGPVTVYNLTTDPGRMTNLFQTFVSGGIQLTSRQTGFIEASFMARPAVFIGAEEFIQLSTLPSIVVSLTNLKERRDLRIGNREIDYAHERRRARVGLSRTWFDADFRISCQSDLVHESVTMADAINRALTYHQQVFSESTGEDMRVPKATPFTPSNRVAQGLYVRDYICTLYCKAWLRRDLVLEEYLSEKIVVHTHPLADYTSSSDETVTVEV